MRSTIGILYTLRINHCYKLCKAIIMIIENHVLKMKNKSAKKESV